MAPIVASCSQLSFSCTNRVSNRLSARRVQDRVWTQKAFVLFSAGNEPIHVECVSSATDVIVNRRFLLGWPTSRWLVRNLVFKLLCYLLFDFCHMRCIFITQSVAWKGELIGKSQRSKNIHFMKTEKKPSFVALLRYNVVPRVLFIF